MLGNPLCCVPCGAIANERRAVWLGNVSCPKAAKQFAKNTVALPCPRYASGLEG